MEDKRSDIDDESITGTGADDTERDEDTSIKVEITSDEEDGAEEFTDPEVAEETAAGEPVKEEEPRESESERYIRLAAEFDNYKKRTAREFGELFKTANERLLKQLIEIIDNFERALSDESAQGGVEAYRQGVELIYGQLVELMTRENVVVIEAIGKPFDPNYHEALMQQASDEYDEGTVCGELQKGYRIGNRVLRHSRVIVSTGATHQQENNESE